MIEFSVEEGATTHVTWGSGDFGDVDDGVHAACGVMFEFLEEEDDVAPMTEGGSLVVDYCDSRCGL